MKEPTETEIQRVKFVLMQFVQPWSLPLNPENLDLMAYCALRYGVNSTGDWAEVEESVAKEIQQDQEQHERMLEGWQENIDEEKQKEGGSEAP